MPAGHWPLGGRRLAQNQYLEPVGVHILGQMGCELGGGCPWSLVTDQAPRCCRSSLLGSGITQINNSRQKSVLCLLWKLKLPCAQSSRNEHGCSASDFKMLSCSTQVRNYLSWRNCGLMWRRCAGIRTRPRRALCKALWAPSLALEVGDPGPCV